MWWPALAGVVIGVGGLVAPRALGVGYESIGELLAGTLSARATLALIVVKLAIWSFALGSGTSGGVLAPLLMLGAGVGALESALLPQVGPGFWPLISMAAVFGGTMRSPITAVLFALEVTHDWDAALPLIAGVVVAHGVTVLGLRRSILTEKVSRRGYHVTREYSIDPLEVLFVREVMRPVAPEVLDIAALPVLAGEPLSASPDETLRTITHRMAETGVTEALVARPELPGHVLGKVTLADVLMARRRHLEEETRRERVLPLGVLLSPWWKPSPKSRAWRPHVGRRSLRAVRLPDLRAARPRPQRTTAAYPRPRSAPGVPIAGAPDPRLHYPSGACMIFAMWEGPRAVSQRFSWGSRCSSSADTCSWTGSASTAGTGIGSGRARAPSA